MKNHIPDAALTQHIIALGKTGSGKSSKLRVSVERLLELGMPVTIVDPKGDWWGLKSSADGKRAGYPIVIFGGEHADVPINAHSGAHIAELVATGNRPALIDLGGWMVGERTRFFVDFAAAYFKLARGVRHLVLPECHNFAPQGKILDPDAGKMLHWANRLASEGRGRGITILADSQRPQKVHKDFLTSCETLIACKVIHKLDRDAIKDWIDGCADGAKGREVIAGLAQLKKPEAWVWSPEIDFGPELVTFPMFKTFDSFKPQAADAGKLKGWAEVDLDDVKTKLAGVVQEAKANDPKALKAEIAELKKQLAAKPAGGPSDSQLYAERNEGFQEGKVAGYRLGFKEAVDGARARVTRELNQMAGEIDQVAALVAPARQVVTKRTGPMLPTAPTTRKTPTTSTTDLPKGEAAVLAALIQYPLGLRREQLTVLTGYKRSSRDAYIQRLREKGFVDTNADRVQATKGGIDAMPDAEPLPTGDALQQFWLARLPEGERKILQVLIDAGGQSIDRDSLEAETGYKRSSRDAYLQRLRAKELIEEPSRGQVAAAGQLFE